MFGARWPEYGGATRSLTVSWDAIGREFISIMKTSRAAYHLKLAGPSDSRTVHVLFVSDCSLRARSFFLLPPFENFMSTEIIDFT
jgi:hypothetical protein